LNNKLGGFLWCNLSAVQVSALLGVISTPHEVPVKCANKLFVIFHAPWKCHLRKFKHAIVKDKVPFCHFVNADVFHRVETRLV
jgi:hypothetical protein